MKLGLGFVSLCQVISVHAVRLISQTGRRLHLYPHNTVTGDYTQVQRCLKWLVLELANRELTGLPML